MASIERVADLESQQLLEERVARATEDNDDACASVAQVVACKKNDLAL